MKEETLLEIKEKIEKEKQEIIEYNKRVKRIKKLLEMKSVKEYLELIDEEPSELDYKTIDEELIIKIVYERMLYKINKNDTNKIYVCTGTYKMDDCYDVIHGPRDYLVSSDYPYATHRNYWDLEQNMSFDIAIRNCEEFEKNNIVIFEGRHSYYKIRQEFISEALKKGQKEAVKSIIKRYKK